MKKPLLLAASLVAFALPAHAGRPLSTDDAGTVGNMKYQIEGWREYSDNQHSTTLAPAVGFSDFEFGIELGRTRAPEGVKVREQAFALKWAPEYLSLGPVRFAAKAWHGRSEERTEEERLKTRENAAIAVATWSITEDIAAHLNLGAARNQAERRNERIANIGASWSVHERVTLFAEALHQQYAPTTQSTGLRFWAMPEKLGLDLTVSREAGVRNSRCIGIGFGWYGDL